MSENQQLLDDFTAYCKANPSMRFWQALRNWSGNSFILAVEVGNPRFDPSEFGKFKDTFYWRTKRG